MLKKNCMRFTQRESHTTLIIVFNLKLYKKLKDNQLSPDYKRKKAQFIIKNNFTNKSVKASVKKILKDIL